MIKEWIAEYNPRTKEDATAALREVMQEVALAGLQRNGFFEKAAFYGGTALRIFHGLNRFSEDLDFSLLQADPDFSLEPYFEGVVREFAALGMTVSIREKSKVHSNIASAFLKSETIWKEIVLEHISIPTGAASAASIKVKIEVDREPPLSFETEEKLLLRPFSFYVKCFTLPNLFAGKMHALLFRNWKTRVKGRDWYDLEWYIKKGVPLDLIHFAARAKDSGHWSEETIASEQIVELLKKRIQSVSFDAIREDIDRFVPDPTILNIWSPQYFTDLADKIKFSSARR